MNNNNDIPQFVACGLEMGNCPRQISYDMPEHERIIRESVIEEILEKIEEGVCHECEHSDIDCFKNCSANNWEYEALKKWLKEQK